MNRRLESVAAEPAAIATALVSVAKQASIDAEAAYETLRPAGRTWVPYLGPAFFTKYLYFAGGGSLRHPCLILDARVAQALHQQGWRSLKTGGGWPAVTYGRYNDLLHRWASEASTPDRPVAADEIELWLFRGPL